MTRQELLQRSSALLGRFAHEVKVANAMGHFDINTIAEDFLIPVFRIAFDCPALCNQNRIQMNFPAIDLGCKNSRTSIQITSDASSSKVHETLEKFDSHNLSSDFDSLYVYVITEKQKSYTSQKLTEAANSLSIEFDPSSDILDLSMCTLIAPPMCGLMEPLRGRSVLCSLFLVKARTGGAGRAIASDTVRADVAAAIAMTAPLHQ